MAVSIDWGTKVINIPKADMELIQSDPEIRELNLNEFRLALKNLEDSEAGIPYHDTHSHNTEVSISGLDLARVIKITNGYTVTFEDGQYAVNAVGANSNLADVMNVNQVSLRSFNAAGLVNPGGTEDVAFIRNVVAGRWKIDGTQMVFYGEDNITEMARFDLYDASGQPSADPSNIFERARV